ncbi:MAG: hypothetical protein ABWY94_12875 [Pseudoxanthomonas sp.]
MSESLNSRSRKHVFFSLKLAAVIVGGSLLLTLARQQGWIGQDEVVRGYNVIMGLALAVYGNFLPKVMHEMPARTLQEATLAQGVGRVTSWSMTLAFLIWAALWAFAPRDFAFVGSIVAVVASVVVMFGYIAWKAGAGRASRSD